LPLVGSAHSPFIVFLSRERTKSNLWHAQALKGILNLEIWCGSRGEVGKFISTKNEIDIQSFPQKKKSRAVI